MQCVFKTLAVNAMQIEKLKGRENFAQWKTAILDLDDLWDGVVIVKRNQELDPDKDRKAKNKLILSVDSSCIPIY